MILLLSGCATLGEYNVATGRREFIFISTAEEVEMGQSIHQQLSSAEKISTSQRIERIGQRLAEVSDRQDYQYQFFVVEKDELNAFTIPGGRIYIYTGLINKLGSDDEIAAVLSHEIGHCAARHAVKKFQAALGYQLIGNMILGGMEGERARQVASLGSGAIMNIVFSSYGRQDEYEADKLGLKYMDAGGYDMAGMIKTFAVLEKEEARGSGVPLILRSHPYASDRIARIKEEIAKIER